MDIAVTFMVLGFTGAITSEYERVRIILNPRVGRDPSDRKMRRAGKVSVLMLFGGTALLVGGLIAR